MIKEVAKKLDDQLDFNKIVGGWAGKALELFDGKAFEFALEYAYKSLPDNLKPSADEIMRAYISDDYSNVTLEAVEKINNAIDIPYLDEQDEEILISAFAGAFFKIVKRKIGDS